jgi:hypothetical protein
VWKLHASAPWCRQRRATRRARAPAAELEQPTPLPTLLKRAQKIKHGGSGASPDGGSGGGGPQGPDAGGGVEARAAMFGDLETRSHKGKDGKRYTINFLPKQLQLGPLFGGWPAGWACRTERRLGVRQVRLGADGPERCCPQTSTWPRRWTTAQRGTTTTWVGGPSCSAACMLHSARTAGPDSPPPPPPPPPRGGYSGYEYEYNYGS